MEFDNLLIYSYSFVPIIGLVGYVPQIISLIKMREKLESFPMAMWGLWFAASVISLLYGVFHLQDTLFSITAGSNTIAIAIVMSLATYRLLDLSRFKIDARIYHHIDHITN